MEEPKEEKEIPKEELNKQDLTLIIRPYSIFINGMKKGRSLKISVIMKFISIVVMCITRLLKFVFFYIIYFTQNN
jgi:hypothetical protein